MSEDAIRDLGQLHGYENLSDDTVQDVKRKISNVYIDRVLDGATVSEIPATESKHDNPE